MRIATFVFLALAGVSSVAAQTQSRAQIELTILGGAVSGHSLWQVGKQPVAVGSSGESDTLALGREVTSSIVIGAGATYFVSPHLGVHAEISYIGLPFDDSCTRVYVAPSDTAGQLRDACNDIQSRSGSGGAISLFAGATFRLAPHHALSPYLRGSVGVVSQPHSSVEMSGDYLTVLGPVSILVIADPSPRHATPLIGLALGLTTPVSKSGGYQFRLEARDMITSFERVIGPANSALVAPTASRYYHHIGLTLGLDVVLEKARGRRY